MPRARGGRDEATNLVTACRDCNNGKRADLIDLPDYVVLAPLDVPRGRVPQHGHGWQAEARLRWPDAMDMVEAVGGQGRYATVTWCAGLLVVLWPTAMGAAAVHARLKTDACGHGCWHDHELVDLAHPQRLWTGQERSRGLARARHFRDCRACQYIYAGQAPAAAILRMQDRISLCAA